MEEVVDEDANASARREAHNQPPHLAQRLLAVAPLPPLNPAPPRVRVTANAQGPMVDRTIARTISDIIMVQKSYFQAHGGSDS